MPKINRTKVARRAVAGIGAAAIAAIGLAEPTSASVADSDDRDARSTVKTEGVSLPTSLAGMSQAKAKATLADAFYAALIGEAPRAAYERLEAQYVKAHPEEAAAFESADAQLMYDKTLGLKHIDQNKNWWCGPATARMIVAQLKADGTIDSANSQYPNHPDGVSRKLTQGRLARGVYLDARYDGTYRTDMRRGLNRWIYGEGDAWYQVENNPITREVKARVTFDVYRDYSMAIAAKEYAGRAHYNGHPVNSTIDHWLAVRGYIDNGEEIKFADPATGIDGWSDVDSYFSPKTKKFVSTWVHATPEEVNEWGKKPMAIVW